MADGPDFLIIVGREKATINPRTLPAIRWLNKKMDAENGYVTIDREAVDEIEAYIRVDGWIVEVK